MKSHHYLFMLLAAISCHADDKAVQSPFVQDLCDYPCPENTDLINEVSDDIDPIDLNEFEQDFIIETKKICIPDHPHAFNPSIVRWKGNLLLSFRTYNPLTRSTNPFGLVWLDENFDPMGTPQIFELPFNNPVLVSKQQDPRLVTVGDRLYTAYNNILEHVTHREVRRMYISELKCDGDYFTASEPECLMYFEGECENRYEKNWPPFDYKGQLHLGYSLIPHKIFRPILGTNACETLFCSSRRFKWEWGVPRGGTQAIKDGDHYIGFFHSWINVPTIQSGGKKITHYFMGAYTFQSKPPFAITAVSSQPIVAKEFYEPPYYKTWKPLRCVFPSGIVLDKDHVWVAYGRQDHEMWIAKMDKKKLLASLVPVSE